VNPEETLLTDSGAGYHEFHHVQREAPMPEEIPPTQNQNSAANHDPASLADQLKQECDRLRRLAEQLEAREKALAEMEANYPYFKAAVYAWLHEKAQELPPFPDKDLETLVKEEGGQELAEFIDDL
jgi:hypothetical protein